MRRRHTLQVNTFPFLAVLLCAMGSLILVLLVMDRRSHLAARQRAEEEAQQQAHEHALAKGRQRAEYEAKKRARDAAWEKKRDALRSRVSAEETALSAELREVQERLARTAQRLKAEEAAAHNLRERIMGEQGRIARQEEQLRAGKQEASALADKAAAADQARAKLAADLVELERVFAELKKARERDEQTFSVVPYLGKRGDSRRPLYVECGERGFVLHPEQAKLDSPTGDALREELARRFARQKEELLAAGVKDVRPYLMLLVRPEGIWRFYEAQAAARQMQVDYGYEFVNSDWKFHIPEGPSLTKSVEGGKAPRAGLSSGVAGPTVREGAAAPGAPPSALPHGRACDPRSPAAANGGGGGRVGNPANPESAGSQSGVRLVSPAPAGGPGAGGGVAGAGSSRPRPDTLPGAGSSRPRSDAFPGASLGSAPATPSTAAPGGTGTGGKPGTPGSSAPAGVAAGGPPTAPNIGLTRPVPFGTELPPIGGPASTSPPSADGNLASITTPVKPPAPAPTGDLGITAPPLLPAPPGAKAPPASAAVASSGNGGNGKGNGNGGGDGSTGASEGESQGPRIGPEPAPGQPRRRLPLRPAQISGAREVVFFVECRPDEVVVYPTRAQVSLDHLTHSPMHNKLYQTVRQLILRQQAHAPDAKVQIRFLIHRDAERTFHRAYPVLEGLPVPKAQYHLMPDDDVARIVAGY
jgi:hypothetical protein